MPSNPNKLSQFWQELKRRKVVRAITVYAAAAFVILELVSIIVDPLKLPEWTLQFAIVFLCIGFIIAVILSWIYDMHPEEGIVKTEPVHKVKPHEEHAGSSSWKIASYISFVVIIALIILNIIPRAGRSAERAILDKSIAVLPFINDSPDEENAYFINGTMEAILDNLSKIEDLRVVSRTSVEQYRDAPKTIPEVGREMQVAYVLEGSGQKYGNQVRLTLQLIDAVKDEHVWSNPYVREIELESIFDLQSEIAQLVAREIQAVITPEEKQLIDKIPTSSLNAYDLYQKGREAQRIYESDYSNREAGATAEALYRQSLQYDSTFAQAYLGLASIRFAKLSWANDSVQNRSILDSSLIFANTALSFNDQLADAYTFKGYYYRLLSETNQALQEWEKAISLNPNSAGPYQGMGWLYYSKDNYVKSIESFVKASSLNRGPELPAILKDLGFALSSIGFFSNSKQQYQEALNLDGDTSSYYVRLAYVELCAGNYAKAIEASQKAISKDSNNPRLWDYLGISYLHLGQFEESLYYFRKYTEELESSGRSNGYTLPYVAYAFLQNGFTEESEIYVNEQIIQSKEWLENRISGFEKNYFRLALVYAFTGDKEKAYENLRLLKSGDISVNVMNYRNDPLFEKIRDEAEFQQIMNDLEPIYQTEHERVRQWLEENDML